MLIAAILSALLLVAGLSAVVLLVAVGLSFGWHPGQALDEDGFE